MHRLRSFLSALRPTRLGVLFAVLIGLGVGFWQWGRPPRPRVEIENLRLDFGWCVFSPNGRTLAIAENSPNSGDWVVRSLSLWDVFTGQKKLHLLKDVGLRSAAFSPDGQTLACLFPDKVSVWNLAEGQLSATYPWEAFHSWLFFAPDGKLLAGRNNDLWDVAQNKLVKKLVSEGEQVIGRGNALLVLTKRDTVKVWNLAGAKICAALKAAEFPEGWKTGEPFVWAHLAPDVPCLIAQHLRGGPVLVFHLSKGEKQEIAATKFPGTYAPVISPNGKTIALGISRGTEQPSWWSRVRDWLGLEPPSDHWVTLCAIPSGQETVSLKGCSNPVYSADGRTLAVIGADCSSLQLWDLPIRKPIGKILGLAGLTAIATLLVFNGLGWLRRRRMRLKAG